VPKEGYSELDFPTKGERWCFVPIKNWFAVIVGVICITLGLSSPTAFGQAFHTTSAMNTGQDWFNTNPVYSNTVWVRTDKGGTPSYASGIMLDSYNMLVSGHQLFSTSQGGQTNTVVMGTGTSHLTDPGTTYAASHWEWHSGWNGSVFSQSPDIGIVHFSEGIPGFSALTIGSSILGEELRGGGFGRRAVGGQWQDLDGFGRGYKMWVDNFGTQTVSTDYIRSDFLPTFLRSDPMAGGATFGSSGSGVFNLSGDLVGLTVGYGGSMPAPGFATFSLRLDLYEDWITPRMYVVPAPGALALLGMAGLFGALRRRAA